MHGAPPDVIYEEVLTPTPGHRVSLWVCAAMAAAGCAIVWAAIPLLLFDDIPPGRGPDWSLALPLSGFALIGAVCAAGALLCASWTRPLRVRLTEEGIVFAGLLGWGPRRIARSDITECSRAAMYRVPAFTFLLDKVYGLPFGRHWAYGPHFRRYLWDVRRTWTGVLICLTDGRTVFIQVDRPEGLLRALQGMGVARGCAGG